MSNTNPKHIRDEIEKRYTFPNLVSGSVYSFNVGLRKPHKEIYLTAAELAGTQPANSIFIDDMAENIDAATEVGFTGIQYLSTEQLIEDLTQLRYHTKRKGYFMKHCTTLLILCNKFTPGHWCLDDEW